MAKRALDVSAWQGNISVDGAFGDECPERAKAVKI